MAEPDGSGISARLLRLPLWYGMGEEVDSVIATLRRALGA
jgi:hypothetical protein